MNSFAKFAACCAAVSVAFGAGYKIPEQSSDAVALANANIAYSFGPDASYYNPANMVWFDDANHLELSATYIFLKTTDFTNRSSVPGTGNVSSKSLRFLVPTFHYVSPEILPNTRFGVSLILPAGMSMDWEPAYPKATAKRFLLKIFELNPSVAYKFSDQFSVAVGARALYSTGEAQNEINMPLLSTSRDLEGDSVDFGYNVALSYRPTDDLAFAATYRSKVNLTIKGDAKIKARYYNGFEQIYDGAASIDLPMPASFTLGAAYKYRDFTFLAAYDRIFWSALKSLDFNYPSAVPFPEAYDAPLVQNYKDTSTYRLGMAWQMKENLRLMAGFAYDEKAIPDEYLSFNLPDTAARVYSFGANYKVSDSLEIQGAFLYQDRLKSEASSRGSSYLNTVDGYFDRSTSILTNLAFRFKF